MAIDTRIIGKWAVRSVLSGVYQDVATPHNSESTPNVLNEIFFEDGTGLNKAQIYFRERKTLTFGQSVTYDLADGTMLDPFGHALAFSNVKVLLIIPASANTKNVRFGNATDAWEAWTPDAASRIDVVPGGELKMVAPTIAGYAVTGGSDQIKIENPSATSIGITYDIYLLGEGTAT